MRDFLSVPTLFLPFDVGIPIPLRHCLRPYALTIANTTIGAWLPYMAPVTHG